VPAGGRKPGLGTRLAGAALLGLFLVGTAEVAAYVTASYLAKHYGILFYQPHITEDYQTYQARLNPRLGWPSPHSVPKPPPGATDPDRPPLMSAYGDSFTAGYGVAPAEVWSAVLGGWLGAVIANYGVPGYGTDQAYLCYHHNQPDGARVVLFGFLSENIQRNVNQLRNFLVPSPQCQTKPRFRLDHQGRLQYVPMPTLSGEDYPQFINTPERFLQDDYFAPGGPSGAQRVNFPYVWRLARTYPFFYNRLVRGYKSYLQFYQPGHPSGAYELTQALLTQFGQEAARNGQHPLILVIPTHEDLFYYKDHRRLAYEPLVGWLKKAGLDVVDVGQALAARLGDRNPLEIFSQERYYHFNAEGNRLVARILYEYVTSKGIVAIGP